MIFWLSVISVIFIFDSAFFSSIRPSVPIATPTLGVVVCIPTVILELLVLFQFENRLTHHAPSQYLVQAEIFTQAVTVKSLAEKDGKMPLR